MMWGCKKYILCVILSIWIYGNQKTGKNYYNVVVNYDNRKIKLRKYKIVKSKLHRKFNGKK